MKNDTVNLWLICIAYFAIGLLLSSNYYYHRNMTKVNDSVDRLILIEMITEQQFNIMKDRVDDLENKHYRMSYNEQ